jgi:hypothetical protein
MFGEQTLGMLDILSRPPNLEGRTIDPSRVTLGTHLCRHGGAEYLSVWIDQTFV